MLISVMAFKLFIMLISVILLVKNITARKNLMYLSKLAIARKHEVNVSYCNCCKSVASVLKSSDKYNGLLT